MVFLRAEYDFNYYIEHSVVYQKTQRKMDKLNLL